MPQTKLNLDQSTWIGGSGTFVADEELKAASGVLFQTAHEELVTTSGYIIENLGSFIEGVEPVYFNTVLNFPWRGLSIKGDENNGTPIDVQGFPTIRLNKTGVEHITWNLRAPAGGASGVNLEFVWTPGATVTGRAKFQLRMATFPSGASLATIAKNFFYLNLSGPPDGGNWTKDKIYINRITASGCLTELGSFNIQLLFDGTGSTMSTNVHILATSINFYSISSGVIT